MAKSFDKNWERSVYSKGRQFNSYPYDILVSIVARKFFHFCPKDRKNLKVLDLGCGAGNNAKFFAENGFSVFGIDGSKTALSFCKKVFKKNKLKGNFAHGDFLHLPYEDNFFDLIIDRESLYANVSGDIQKIINEAYKKLKTGGYFISFTFSSFHPDKKFGNEIEPNTYDNFTKGSFYGTGKAHFSTINEILKNFSQFKIENIIRHSLSGVFDEYIIIAKKL